jgi:alcohol dehydrogenase class IV
LSQKILQGTNQLDSLLQKYQNPLIVHGKAYEQCDIFRQIDQRKHAEFIGFSSNPTYEQICDGVAAFRQGCHDAIIAIGGGSAIDVAKCIKLFWKMDDSMNYLEQPKRDTGIPLIAIPTTAGTGSESTQHAVLYYKGEKQSISHESILPDYAILIPETLDSLPVYQRKCAMLDALGQAIESWWSVASTKESIAYSYKALELIRTYWKEYIDFNSDTAKANILLAANYAGCAIHMTATTAAHAMSYKITSMYGLPHGHAVALCLSAVWRYMEEHTEQCADKRGAMYLKQVLCDISMVFPRQDYEELLKDLQIHRPISESKERDMELLVKSVNQTRLANNPIYLEETVLWHLYEEIVK